MSTRPAARPTRRPGSTTRSASPLVLDLNVFDATGRLRTHDVHPTGGGPVCHVRGQHVEPDLCSAAQRPAADEVDAQPGDASDLGRLLSVRLNAHCAFGDQLLQIGTELAPAKGTVSQGNR